MPELMVMSMPKKTDGASQATPKKRPKKFAVEIDDDLARKLRVVAGGLGVTVPDFVNNSLRPIVEARLPEVLTAMEIGPIPDPKKK